MARRRSLPPGRPMLALRGLVAVGVAGVVAAVLVGRASGNLDPVADVFVGIPASAGLITTAAPVRYHGVNVGRIADIESGTKTSVVRLAIDRQDLDLIPESVVARVVPRTFFGDVYVQLNDGQGGTTARPLAAGATISIDTSADAMALYGVFTKVVDIFSQIKPEKMQTALTALSQALQHRGQDIGATIDNLSDVAATLTPSAVAFLDSTPQFRDVMAALHTATPDIISTLSAATTVSTRMLDDRTGLTSMLDELAGLGSVLTGFFSDHREQLITVLDAGGKILASTAQQPQGVLDTLAGAKAFGEAGSRSFSTGKFNITAVATFAGPMPYTAADCPVYGKTYGAHCADADPVNPLPAFPLDVPVPAGVDPLAPPIFAPFPPGQPRGAGPAPATPAPTEPTPAEPTPAGPEFPAEAHGASAIVGGGAEGHALALLQNEILRDKGGSAGPQDAQHPDIATVLMLGPLVRGTEVHVA